MISHFLIAAAKVRQVHREGFKGRRQIACTCACVHMHVHMHEHVFVTGGRGERDIFRLVASLARLKGSQLLLAHAEGRDRYRKSSLNGANDGNASETFSEKIQWGKRCPF